MKRVMLTFRTKALPDDFTDQWAILVDGITYNITNETPQDYRDRYTMIIASRGG